MRCEIMINKIQCWKVVEGGSVTIFIEINANYLSHPLTFPLRRDIVRTNEVNNKVENYFIIQSFHISPHLLFWEDSRVCANCASFLKA